MLALLTATPLALLLPPSSLGWACVRHAPTSAGHCGVMSVAMASVATPPPGQRNNRDADALRDDAMGFCAERMRQYGDVFVTGVSPDSVFVGDPVSLEALSTTATASPPASASKDQLGAPFGRLSGADAAAAGDDLYTQYAARFNEICYDEMFKWIPRYKEAGFSTFRFEDFIDGRVRRLLPSVRALVLRATAPALFGVDSFDEVAQALGFESPADAEKAYAAYAAARRPAKLTIGMPSLFDLEGGGGDADALRRGLAQWARRGGAGGLLGAAAAAGVADGDALLAELASSVEQTAALACSMLAAAHLHPAAAASLPAEQAEALEGMGPTEAIGADALAKMPKLHAFALETLRMYPPSRPAPFRLAESTTVPTGGGARSIELPAGARVAPEPFVAHFSATAFAQPRVFDPTRFLDAPTAADAPPTQVLIPFGSDGATSSPVAAFYCRGGAAEESGDGAGGAAPAGAALAVSMAKAIYVQARRMFEDTVIGASPPAEPSGYALHTIGEKVEVLVKPRMYYELQRGVKKLRF